ncbi:MAG TPA: hypothetical protein VD968_00220 [Pyrinomonadaceae bacterium]|nr:hypothetical protein [Pyrinomonadaceae bacterium]
MRTRTTTPTLPRTLAAALLAAALACLVSLPAAAQQTAGGTTISNTATATYEDPGGTPYETSSNTVVVTVANVSGLAVTPDDASGGGASGTVVAGEANGVMTFVVSNTGNFADTVSFKGGGASFTVGGAITAANVTAAFFDANSNNVFDAGDTDLWSGPDMTTASVPAGESRNVIVRFTVPAGATGTVDIQLGDAGGASPFDNQALSASAADVANTTAGVNGRSEARGSRSLSVLSDARIQTYLTAPAGPINPGGDVNYVVHTCNVSASQAASATTLTNVSNGSNSGVFEILPIPAQTALKAGQTFPAGTLYSTSALTDDPVTTAQWDGNAPANLANVRRIALNRGASLAGGACTSDVTVLVVIDANADADLPVLGIADSFANNTFGARITDQSADNVSGFGNGRADLSPAGSNPDGSNLSQPGNLDGDGVLLLTLIAKVGSVFNGPNGAPRATGTAGNTNNDFTNRSVNTGIAGVAPGGSTTAAGASTFTNTVENPGNADDVFTLSVVNFASLPAGTSLVITTANGSVTVDGANPSGSVTINVARGATANYTVQFNLPSGQTVLTGYEAVIRATSTNTPSATNDTIDRLYTGFLRLVKSVTVDNATGVGGATDAVPGAHLVYAIQYENVSLAQGTGSGSVTLTASNVVISEKGDEGSNNWATHTTQVVGGGQDPTDSTTGVITDGNSGLGVTAATNWLKDTIPSVAPGASGTFTFRRRIN